MTVSRILAGSLFAVLLVLAAATVGFYELFSNFRA
jgi:hypothetical protein